MPFLAKMTKTLLVNPRSTEGQMKSKLSQNNTFHSFTSNLSFLEIFGKFDLVDPELTSAGPRNPNFDPVIKKG